MKNNNLTVLWNLTKRHFLVFMKNKIRVLYTLMVPVIVFIIYLVLLRNLESQMLINELLKQGLINSDGSWLFPEMQKDCMTIMDFWMLAGILGISAITISIQSNNIMVNDKENGVNRDFVSSPVNKKILITSYFLFNFIVTFILCFAFSLICLIYLAIAGEFVISFVDVLVVLGMLVLACLLSTLFTIFICAFIKREPTLASIIAVFSSAVGFLVGAYMPFGLFPDWLQGVCCFIPGTHSVGLLRYGFMNTSIERFKAYYQPKMTEVQFNGMMEQIDKFGFNIKFFGQTATPQVQGLVVAGSILLFGFLSLMVARFIANVEDKR